MNEPILYMDISEVRDGKLPELLVAIDELVAFIKEKVPRIIFYKVFLSEDNRYMTILQMHPDAASLEYQMVTGMAVFAKFKYLIKLISIDLYGKPSEKLVQQLKSKAVLLGGATLAVHTLHAGINNIK